MKQLLSIKGMFLYIIGVCLFIGGCSNEEWTNEIEQHESENSVKTRATDFHWKCKKCGFLNGPWKNNCLSCGVDYNSSHGKLVLSLITIIENNVGFVKTISKADEPRAVELPTLQYPLPTAEPWYETPKALQFYNELKTLYYNSNAEYREGVDFAWYRTVRALYPKYTKSVIAERTYDKFILNEGRNLTGPNGSGLKDGAKAAIEAFAATR